VDAIVDIVGDRTAFGLLEIEESVCSRLNAQSGVGNGAARNLTRQPALAHALQLGPLTNGTQVTIGIHNFHLGTYECVGGPLKIFAQKAQSSAVHSKRSEE
jgi:hypothetical protein